MSDHIRKLRENGYVSRDMYKIEKPEIKLNWENSEFAGIDPNEIVNYKTVPALKEILFDLL